MRQRREVERKFQREKALNTLATPGVFPLVIVLDQLKTGFNIGKIFRSAEVFGCREVHVLGTRFFDPYPSKGGFKQVPARFMESFDTSFEQLNAEGYEIFVFDPSAESDLSEINMTPKTAFVFGHEEFGVRFNFESFPGLRKVKIKQYGQIQSLNVSVAASIAMYEYARQLSLR